MRLIAAATFTLVLCSSAARAGDPADLPPLPAAAPAPETAPADRPVVIVVATPPAAASEMKATPARPTRLTPPGPDLSLDATFGFGTPVGWLGAGLTVHPINRFALSAGVGLGTRGVQVAGMLHGYPVDLGKWARLGFGAGASSGTYATSAFSSGLDLKWRRYWQRAWFLNLETSIAVWHPTGAGIEPFIGYGIVLNDKAGACSTWRSDCSHFTGVLYFGVKGHFGFDL